MGQRAYCDQDHPIADADADRWCEQHHRVKLPVTRCHWCGRDVNRPNRTRMECGWCFDGTARRTDDTVRSGEQS